MDDWLVVRCKPRRERIAAVNVERQGCEFYLPLLRDEATNRLTPLFPSYLFVRLPNEQFYFLRSTEGVAQVLMSGYYPALIHADEISKLRIREDAAHTIPWNEKAFHIGDTLFVKQGPLADHVVTFDGMSGQERICVLVSILGRKSRVTMPIAWVEACTKH